MPQPGNTPYSASKWGVVGLSLGLRFEGADLGVKVTCVCPGDMKTDIYKNLTVVNLDKSTIERDSRRTHFLLPQWTAERAAREILAGVAAKPRDDRVSLDRSRHLVSAQDAAGTDLLDQPAAVPNTPKDA